MKSKKLLSIVAVALLAVICVCLALGSQLSKGKTTSDPTSQPAATETKKAGSWNITKPQTAATEARNKRCVPASEKQIALIRYGVQEISKTNDIKSAWAVKSSDYSNVWFVAAKIYGDGMENGTPDPGVWAINGNPDDTGIALSVDGYALQFSSWPDGSKTDATTSMLDDGAQIARDCAR